MNKTIADVATVVTEVVDSTTVSNKTGVEIAVVMAVDVVDVADSKAKEDSAALDGITIMGISMITIMTTVSNNNKAVGPTRVKINTRMVRLICPFYHILHFHIVRPVLPES